MLLVSCALLWVPLAATAMAQKTASGDFLAQQGASEVLTRLQAAPCLGSGELEQKNASGICVAENNWLSATDLRRRDQRLAAARKSGNVQEELAVLKEFDFKSTKNTGAINYNSVLTEGALQAEKAQLEQLLAEPNIAADTAAQARRSITEINTAINVIQKSPVLRDAAELGLLAVDVATLGELAAAKALSTVVVRELVASRTGKTISDDIATKITNNFYSEGAQFNSNFVNGANGGTVVGEVAVTTKPIALPAPKVGEVVPNAMSAAETAQAADIVAFKGGKFVGQPASNTPGIDGWLNGVPVSLKEVTGNGMTAVQRNVIGGTNQMSKAGQVGDMYVDATKAGVSTQDVTNWVKPGSPIANVLNEGTVNNINIKTTNGWVTLTRSTIKIPGTP